jgi:hypothetical protein
MIILKPIVEHIISIRHEYKPDIFITTIYFIKYKILVHDVSISYETMHKVL